MFKDGELGLSNSEYRELRRKYSYYIQLLNENKEVNKDEIAEFLNLCDLVIMTTSSEIECEDAKDLKYKLKLLYEI